MNPCYCYGYEYNDVNRMTSVDEVPYTWDNNGNLIDDGVNDYTYDHANRLTSVSSQTVASSYQYNGLGDRLRQTVDEVPTTYVNYIILGASSHREATRRLRDARSLKGTLAASHTKSVWDRRGRLGRTPMKPRGKPRNYSRKERGAGGGISRMPVTKMS
jgi:YD repeat-containing protein